MTDIYNALILMLLGCFTVFMFLGIMIFCMQAITGVCKRYAHLLPEKQLPKRRREPKVAEPAPHPATYMDSGVLPAVITAAIHAYREQNS